MPSAPLVTIGLPTYNRAEALSGAIPRILSQSYANFELIVCDDGSSDHTVEVVRGMGDDRITFLRNKSNLGIPAVLNRILGSANGDGIVMLHDHDVALPGLIESMTAVLDSQATVGFVNPGVAWIDEDGGGYQEMGGLPAAVTPGHDLVRTMLSDPSFSCPITACALVRRSAYQSVGFRYDESFGFLSDVDLWLRLGMVTDVGQADGVGLICRRRGPEHVLAGQEWRLLDWALGTREAALRRLHQGCPVQLSHALDEHRQFSRSARRRQVAGAAARGDVAGLSRGIDQLSRTGSPWEAMVARRLVGSDPAARALVGMATRANRLRKAMAGRGCLQPRRPGTGGPGRPGGEPPSDLDGHATSP